MANCFLPWSLSLLPLHQFFIYLQPAAQQRNHWNMKSPGIFKSVTRYLSLYNLCRKPLLASWESLQGWTNWSWLWWLFCKSHVYREMVPLSTGTLRATRWSKYEPEFPPLSCKFFSLHPWEIQKPSIYEIYFKAAALNLFGTSDLVCGKQFFP